jgi:predicted acylesterase/phospholipase RssA
MSDEKTGKLEDEPGNSSDQMEPPLNNKWIPNVLTLGPGGVKGFIELGAITFLENRGFIDKIDTIVGCSVGSIIGLLLIVGYTSLEIITEVFGTVLFDDIGALDFKDAGKNTGIMNHEKIRITLTKLIRLKMGMVPTLHQLYSTKRIIFSVVTYNLTDDKTVYLTAETDPDLSCIDAIILSCNIPLIFYRSKYKGCTYIDGAFGDPYPILKYDTDDNKILGIYIDSDTDDTEDGDAWWYANRIIKCSMNELRRRSIKNSSSRCRHLRLTKKGLTGSLFSYTTDDRRRMISSGYSSARDFYQEITGIDVNEMEHPNVLADSDALKMVRSTEGHVYFTDVDDAGKISPLGRRENRFNREDSNDPHSSRSVEYPTGHSVKGSDDNEPDNGIVIEITPQMRKYLKNLNSSHPDSGGYEIIKGSSSSDHSYSSGGDSDENKNHIHASGQRIREKPRKRHRWSNNNQSIQRRSPKKRNHPRRNHQRGKTESDRSMLSRDNFSGETLDQDRSDHHGQTGFPKSSLGAMQDLLRRKTMNTRDYERLTGINKNDDNPASRDYGGDGIIREENKYNYDSRNKSKHRSNRR